MIFNDLMGKITRNIKLTLQYDGSDYSGWQVQTARSQNTPADSERIWTQGQAEPPEKLRNGASRTQTTEHGTQSTEHRAQTKEYRVHKKITTIQGVLEDAVEKVTGAHSRITGAGRTDAGVHAFNQVAMFRTGSGLSPAVLLRALNANLPTDVRVIKASECHDDFHPRFSTKNKTYSYIISQAGNHSASHKGSVFLRRYSWQTPYDLDLVLMRKAAKLLVGRHDFACFRASGCSSKHAVRTIMKIVISRTFTCGFTAFKLDVPLVKITIQADAFLRYMVRNIVGTLVDVGKGKTSPDEIKKILDSKDRRKAGPTAPPQGLFLENIVY